MAVEVAAAESWGAEGPADSHCPVDPFWGPGPFVTSHPYFFVRSVGAHWRTKSCLLSKIGCFSPGILFIGLPTVSVSAEAERIDLHLTLPGCELKGGKELLAASSNIVISFIFFFPGL